MHVHIYIYTPRTLVVLGIGKNDPVYAYIAVLKIKDESS